MPELVSDTSPLQYLHQLGLLHFLPALGKPVVIPSAVEREILIGVGLGIQLPDLAKLDWLSVRRPQSQLAAPLVHDLGPGETEVLMLGLESPGAVLVLDDALGRRFAGTFKLPFTGTLGLLVDAKKVGLLASIKPCLDRLEELRFRMSASTRSAILELAGESK